MGHGTKWVFDDGFSPPKGRGRNCRHSYYSRAQQEQLLPTMTARRGFSTPVRTPLFFAPPPPVRGVKGGRHNYDGVFAEKHGFAPRAIRISISFVLAYIRVTQRA